MQSMRRRVRLAPSLVVVSLAVLGLAGSLGGWARCCPPNSSCASNTV